MKLEIAGQLLFFVAIPARMHMARSPSIRGHGFAGEKRAHV